MIKVIQEIISCQLSQDSGYVLLYFESQLSERTRVLVMEDSRMERSRSVKSMAGVWVRDCECCNLGVWKCCI